jgi:hypothetical protein
MSSYIPGPGLLPKWLLLVRPISHLRITMLLIKSSLQPAHTYNTNPKTNTPSQTAILQSYAHRSTADDPETRHRLAVPHVRDLDHSSGDPAHVRGLQHREYGHVSAGHVGLCGSMVSLYE